MNLQAYLIGPSLRLRPLIEEDLDELQTIENQKVRIRRWLKRRSPDGRELWLNWAGREKKSSHLMSHFQVGVKQDGSASLGYLVSQDFQKKAFAFEAIQQILFYLKDDLGVREIKALTDTRNEASHRLAKKLGMKQTELIKDADFFKMV